MFNYRMCLEGAATAVLLVQLFAANAAICLKLDGLSLYSTSQ